MEKTRVRFDTLLHLLLDIIPEDQVELRKELKETIEPRWNIAPELRMNDEYWHPIAVVLQSHDDGGAASSGFLPGSTAPESSQGAPAATTLQLHGSTSGASLLRCCTASRSSTSMLCDVDLRRAFTTPS